MNITLFALILFAVSYILLIAFQKYRPYIALASAAVFTIIGSTGLFPEFSYTVSDALYNIDWNVLLMIIGMMGTVYLFTETGMADKMSNVLVSKAGTVGWSVIILSLFAGVISAFLDNVATVLMVAPIALAICKNNKISPVAPLICIAISSNLQGAATLVGDTTSILLAKAAQLDFLDFFMDERHLGMFFVTEAGALASAVFLWLMFRKEKQKVVIDTSVVVKDYFPTVMLVLTIVTLIAVSFIPYEDLAEPGQFYKPDISNGLICMFFFLIGVIRKMIVTKDISFLKKLAGEIDWFTLLLLAGLFVVIGAIDRAGVIAQVGNLMSGLAGDGSRGSVFLIYTVIVWGSVLISAFVDNIPYVVTMLPIIAVLGINLKAIGAAGAPTQLLYYGLLCGATLGGNLTPIGASANVAALGILRKEGYTVSNTEFMKYGVPFTLIAVTVGYVLLWLVWM